MHRTLFIVALAGAAQAAPQCSSSAPLASSQNVQTIVVNAGPTNTYFNGAFTSVTVCAPGSSSCQTIDGVLVDSGSSGLRVLSSVLTVSLPQQTDSNGAAMAECGQFLDGFTWGPVQSADIRMAGEQASAVPIQVIGAPGFTNVPDACSSTGPAEDTLQDLGANAILGVSVFRQDCGLGCSLVGASNPGVYFACSGSTCRSTTQALTKQLQNPVWLFASDNNGISIQLPSVALGGAPSVTGTMTFGIGTQSNNALGSARVLTLDADGNFTTVFNGQSYGSSFIDSGSNGIYFLDPATTGMPTCADASDFYCPATTLTFSATNRGANGATSSVTFRVGNLDALNERFSAFSEVAGPNSGAFDWGLSFFFGRTVYAAIEGQSTPGGSGPFVAY
ncbi:MAG TPA: DUF3443 domain-containing protein [Vicinamibacterales bacterium]